MSCLIRFPRWYGVGGTIQLAFFAMVAAKVKMNANGAHTFLEVRTCHHTLRANPNAPCRSPKRALERAFTYFSRSTRSSAFWLYAVRFCVRRCFAYSHLLTINNTPVGGAATVNALTGMNIIAACFLLPIGIAVYVIFGGLRATFMCDWAHTIILFIIIYLFQGHV